MWDEASFCPGCGAQTQQFAALSEVEAEVEKKKLSWFVGVVAGLAVIVIFIIFAVHSCQTNSIASNDMEDIANAQDKLEEFEDSTDDEWYNETGMSDGGWYNETGMSKGRQGFRFSCLKEGINLVTNGSNGYNMKAIYDNALRNAYGLTSDSIAMSGQVDYIERTGLETVMLIKSSTLTPFIIVARAYDDIPVIKGDWITVFGYTYGIEQYSTTTDDGVTTWHDTISMTIMDYYISGKSSIYASALGDTYTIFNIDYLQEEYYIDGTPSMFEEEKDYWFGTYKNYAHTATLTITEDAVSDDTNSHPYKVYSYYKNPSTGCYVLRIRFTEIENLYPEGGYTLLCLFYQEVRFHTQDSVRSHIFNQGEMTDLLKYQLGTMDSYYVQNKN